MADQGSTSNLAAAVKPEAATEKPEEKETRRQFNYPLIRVP